MNGMPGQVLKEWLNMTDSDSEMQNERRWRNQQLKDALYLKQLGVVNDHIMDEYIAALKTYDLKYQPRPAMPAQQKELDQAWKEWL